MGNKWEQKTWETNENTWGHNGKHGKKTWEQDGKDAGGFFVFINMSLTDLW